MHSASGVIGAADADILVSLKRASPDRGPRPTLRRVLPEEFPGVTSTSSPRNGDPDHQLRLPAPIDVQIDGADVAAIAASPSRC